MFPGEDGCDGHSYPLGALFVMKKHYIDIVGKWAIIFAYNISPDDFDEVKSWLYALGASERDLAHVGEVLEKENTGFTISNPELKMSVMCVGQASDESQWWDSLVHEIDHAQTAIMEHYDVDCGSEEAAYLQGYIMRRIIRVLKIDGQILD